MRKTLLVFAAIYGVALLIVAVLFQSSDRPEADFTYISGAEPKTLDPQSMTGQLEGRFANALYEGLTYEDPKTMEPVPGVAKRWEVSKDGKTWTFYLRQNAKWSNGDVITAHDFVWSWKRALSVELASEYSYMLYDLVNAKEYNEGKIKDFAKVGVKARDDWTLDVTLKARVPYFLYLTAFYTTYPVHRATVEKFDNDDQYAPGEWAQPQHVVTNGPFVISEWITNDRIRLKKNPLYWNADSIRVNTIDALSIEDTTAAINTFLDGEADWNPSSWPASLNSQVSALPEFQKSEAFTTYYYRFNTTKKRGSFHDPRVRRAFCMAINRKEIVENILKLGQKEAFTLVPPGIAAYNPPPGLRHDPDAARKLMAEAGFPGGKGFPKVELLYNTHESHKTIALVIRQQLKKELGVDVQPFNQEWQSYQTTTRAMNYDMARAGWIGDYLDPNTFLNLWVTDGGNNQTGYGNPVYDQLCQTAAEVPSFLANPDESLYAKCTEGERMRALVKAANAATSPDEKGKLAAQLRMLMFREMEIILTTDCPIMPIYFYVTKNLVRSHIGGFYSQLEFPGGKRVPNVRDVHPLRGIYIKKPGE